MPLPTRPPSTLPPLPPRHLYPLPARSRPPLWRFFWVGFLSAVAATGGGLLAYQLRQQILPIPMTEDELAAFRPDALRQATLDRSLNILVLGVDNPLPQQPPQNRKQALQNRSDTILLVRFDPKADRITLISIPRDTFVRYPNRQIGKLNAANAVGGPALAARAVGEMLNLPIDRYIRLNTDGITALIDAIGGVEIDVPYRMKYVDRTQNLTIDLEPGRQFLTGDQAHQFLRFRQDELGDIGRVQRQQELLRALSYQLLQPQNLSRIPKVLEVVRQHLDTNLRWEEVISLAQFLLRSAGERLDMVLLPGRFGQASEGLAGYWIPDRQATQRLVGQMLGTATPPPIDPRRIRIAVQNATGEPSQAGHVLQHLRQQGFSHVFTVEDHTHTLATTQVLAQRGDFNAAALVHSALRVGEVRVQSTGILESDVTIQVGQDWLSQENMRR
ncbi:MAG: LCP family protein [Thermostichales cyanobacterium SZTDM-1c_bins_54]